MKWKTLTLTVAVLACISLAGASNAAIHYYATAGGEDKCGAPEAPHG